MLLTILLSLALIGADQLLKWLAVQYLMPVGAVEVIPGVVGLKYVENTGAAFSILTDKQLLLIIVTGIALLAVAVVLLFRRPKGRLEYTALLLIFAGGVGNLIDRIANGYVVDYVNLLFMNFAVFNFADTLVVAGFILFVIALFKTELKAARNKSALSQAAGEAAGTPEAGAPEEKGAVADDPAAAAAEEDNGPVPPDETPDGDH